MAFELSDTGEFAKAVDQLPIPKTFLADTYFPTDPVSDIITQAKVLIDIRTADGHSMAPYIVRHSGPRGSVRDAFRSLDILPPQIKEERQLTLDLLDERGFGEGLGGTLTPAERSNYYALRDIQELMARVRRSTEWMAAQALLNNGLTFTLLGNTEAQNQTFDVKFYEGDTNPATYTPTTKWDAAGATILDDIDEMCLSLASRNQSATDMLIGSDVANAMLADTKINALLNLRRADLAEIRPEPLPSGASKLGELRTPMGHVLGIYCYAARYLDAATGELNPYIPAGSCVILSRACGHTVYGAVTQVEGEVHVTYRGQFVPKYIGDESADIRKVRLTSNHICVPLYDSPWVVADVTTAPEPEPEP